MKNLSARAKWMIYAALNLSVCMVLGIGAAINGGSMAELPYVAVLFAICTSPLPFIDRVNGTFAMLGVAMAVYFVEFGAMDALEMIKPPSNNASVDQAIGLTEIALWSGALMQVLGFHVAARMTKIRSQSASKDWSPRLLVPIGLMLWSASALATSYHAFVVQPETTAAAVQAGLERLGIWRASGLVLIENYAGPLGIIILAYWWAVWRRPAGAALVLTLCLAQLVVGWVVDTKEVAISAPVIALLTRFLVQGKIPARWLVGAVVAIALVFPIMSAKRVVMTEELGLTRAEALPRTFAILLRTLEEGDAIKTGKYEQSSETFIQRESVKGNVRLIVEGTASGMHPYKLGSTFEPLLYVFFPRVFWSDKPGGNSAQLLNREFHVSADRDTFISPSHVGEWYWNFGFGGVIVGMTLTGALLGYLSVRFDLSESRSVIRVLVIIVTLYLLVARGEGQVEIQYALWARSMLLIGILHLLLARRTGARADASAGRRGDSGATGVIDWVRFPNLMR